MLTLRKAQGVFALPINHTGSRLDPVAFIQILSVIRALSSLKLGKDYVDSPQNGIGFQKSTASSMFYLSSLAYSLEIAYKPFISSPAVSGTNLASPCIVCCLILCRFLN